MSKNPFRNLPIPTNEELLTREFYQAYVLPFYLCLNNEIAFRKAYFELDNPCDPSVVGLLLGECNWRTRSVGSFFAAVCNMSSMESRIGNLLLESESTKCTREYCIALVTFSSDSAIEYLHQYLDHYLYYPEEVTAQMHVMKALAYLGEQRGQNLIERHMPAWDRFVVGKNYSKLETAIEGFSHRMGWLNELKDEISRQ